MVTETGWENKTANNSTFESSGGPRDGKMDRNSAKFIGENPRATLRFHAEGLRSIRRVTNVGRSHGSDAEGNKERAERMEVIEMEGWGAIKGGQTRQRLGVHERIH